MAWDALDKEERDAILSLFPDDQHILAAGTDEAQPDFVSLMNDDSFRHDCAAYVENIAQGRHDVEWLESAWSAHQRRKIGDFDEHLEKKFEEEWGVDVPAEMKPARAASGAPSGQASTSTPSEGALRSSPVADEIVVSGPPKEETNGQDKTEGSEDTQEETKPLENGEAKAGDVVMQGTQEDQDAKVEQELSKSAQDSDTNMLVDA